VTPAAVDAIITAVGREPHDRAELATALDQLRETVRHDREGKLPNLKRVRKALKAAESVILSTRLCWSLEAGIAALLDEIRRLEAEYSGPKLSLTDFMCGYWLPKLFARQFDKRATTTRNGAYVRFAGACLKPLGLKAKPETIIRSLTAVRKAQLPHVGEK
jgi:hypothetical protein